MRLPSWLQRSSANGHAAAWLAVQGQGAHWLAARASAGSSKGKPQVHACHRVGHSEGLAAIGRWAQQNGWQRDPQAQLLPHGDYHMVQVDAPPVEPAELRSAARWLVKDMIDYPVEEAALDCVRVPGDQPGAGKIFAVITRQAKVNEALAQWKAAALKLRVLDIPEMALRNVAVLAFGEQPAAFLHVGIEDTYLLLLWRQELCVTRQLPMGARQLRAMDDFPREGQIERLALEVQRTVDAFGRQFSAANLQQLWVSSLWEPARMCELLAAQLSVVVEPFALEQWVELAPGLRVHDIAEGYDHTLAIGAALREAA